MDKNKYQNILLWIPKEEHQKIKDFANFMGISMTKLLINSALKEIKNSSSKYQELANLRNQLRGSDD